jgi:hypothetical protein
VGGGCGGVGGVGVVVSFGVGCGCDDLRVIPLCYICKISACRRTVDI